MTDGGLAPAARTGHAVIAALMQQVDAVLRPLLPAGGPCALLHFPRSGNAGDSAIWLGTATYLRRIGARIVYACEVATYSRTRLAARLGQGVILLQGGGNLGDLWPAAQRLREEVITAFPDHPIVQLPQTIHFEDVASLARVRAIFNRHPRLTLLLRDRRSLEFARTEFAATSLLCPDMALSLGPLGRRRRAATDVVCLLRSDKESAGWSIDADPPGVARVDWRVEGAIPRALSRGIRLATRHLDARPWMPAWARAGLVRAYDRVAWLRLASGCRMLSAGRCVVTDRLHGHILSLLLGIPHVILDNSYGKLRTFYDTWTQGCDLVDWADSPADAGERAARRVAAQEASSIRRGGTSWSRCG
jgi:pyruvyl transferase EpsO